MAGRPTTVPIAVKEVMTRPNEDRIVAELIRTHFTRHLSHYLELLRQMVEINSYTANSAGVDELGQLTATLFAPFGFSAEFVPTADPEFGHHVVLTRPGQSDDGLVGTKIGLVSHLDTVFPAEEEEANHFVWQPDGERIYGPGTVDIKGGTMLIYMMMDALSTYAPEQFERTTWVILLDAAEERTGPDFGPLCEERLLPDARACLVFEGGTMSDDELLLVVARKGSAHFRVEASGRAAHAGAAHPVGANAITRLAVAVQQIAALTDYERELTFNVGRVAGGTVVNRVPHWAEALVEMRTFDPAVFEAGVAAMLALPDQAEVTSGDGEFTCSLTVTVEQTTEPWPENEATARLWQLWHETGQDLGLPVGRERRGGLSDGNHLWRRMPTLDGLGPAGGNAHCSERSADGSKDQEYVLPASFIPKALLNTLATLRLLATDRPED